MSVVFAGTPGVVLLRTDTRFDTLLRVTSAERSGFGYGAWPVPASQLKFWLYQLLTTVAGSTDGSSARYGLEGALPESAGVAEFGGSNDCGSNVSSVVRLAARLVVQKCAASEAWSASVSAL